VADIEPIVFPARETLVAGSDLEPRPLDARVVTVWRIEGALGSLVALLAGGGLSALLVVLDVPLYLAALPVVAAAIYAAIMLAVVPGRRWTSWRYAIGEAEIELRHGIWWQTWTRIPMARVQHVDTRRGPLERRYGLASIVVYTAAGARQIPGLAIETAEASRDRIATLANVRDDV
jgi:membrane protein YdbS with pleckstrin-like domain